MQALEKVLPVILAWSANREQEILESGEPLTPAQQQLAAESGVLNIERVRLLIVDRVSLPQDPELLQMARSVGLPLNNTAGRALGYGVEIVAGSCHEDRLLRHEFRHVHQFEANGGLAVFLKIYLRSIVEYGYADCSWEQDARRAEYGVNNEHHLRPVK